MEWLQTYKIGKALIDNGQFDEVDAFLVKYSQPIIKQKSKEKSSGQKKAAYILDVVLDLDKNKISLELQRDYSSESLKTDNVFQTIAGNDGRFVLSPEYGKDGKSALNLLNFFSGEKLLKKYTELIEKNLPKNTKIDKKKEEVSKSKRESELLKIREKITKSSLYKDFEFVIKNLKKIIETGNEKAISKIDEQLQQKEITPLFGRLYLSGDYATDYIPYVRLKLIDAGNNIYINRHPEYRKFVMDRNLFELANLNNKEKQENSNCYFSGEQGAFPVRFPRDFTNILRASTDTNTIFRSYLSPKSQNGDRFLISIPSYVALKTGARYINEHLKINIAGMPHYVIPDFVSEFNLKKFRDELNKKVDLAFQNRAYGKLNKSLERISSNGLNSLSFIGFKASNKEKNIDLKNRIQAVKPDRYNMIVSALNGKSDFLTKTKGYQKHNRFTFGTLYTLIPEKKETIYTLSLTKSLLENHPIDKNLLYGHYGRLLHLYWHGRPDGKGFYGGSRNIKVFKIKGTKDHKNLRDRAISVATLKYLILINIIDELYNNHNKVIMEENLIQEKPKTAQFFKQFNFDSSPSKMAMFYLGKMLRTVAQAQSGQGSKHKPILNRVPFEGMDMEEIIRFKNDIVKKMIQYQKSQKAMLYGETDLKHFEYYFCKAHSKWELSETENIFYLFTGYSMYWEVKDEKSIEEMKEVGFDTAEKNDESQTNIIEN